MQQNKSGTIRAYLADFAGLMCIVWTCVWGIPLIAEIVKVMSE